MARPNQPRIRIRTDHLPACLWDTICQQSGALNALKTQVRGLAAKSGSATTSSASNLDKSMEDCQKKIQKALNNPTVKFLIEQLEKSGCPIGDNFIRGVNCGGQYGGGYTPGDGIEVYCEHMIIQDYVTQTLIHELIHAYDECRAANLVWNNRYHQACSEIRANHLSHDCHLIRELLRGNIKKIAGHEKECIKRRAIQSVSVRHSKADAKAAVEAVWDVCYNDTQPFDKAP